MSETRALPIAECSVVQLSRGEPQYRSRLLWGQEVFFIEAQYQQDIAAYLVPQNGWIGIWCPVSWHVDYQRDGQLARPGDFFLSGHRHGYSVRENRCHHFVLGTTARALEQRISSLLGKPCLPLDRFDGRLWLSPDRGLGFQQKIRQIIDTPTRRQASGDGSHLTPGQESATLDWAAVLLIESGMAQEPVRYLGLTDRLIVRRTLDGLERHRGVPSLADACAAAGVGKTRLHQAFQALYGVSPLRFLRLYRMNRVWNRLSDPGDPPASVGDVVEQAGFSNGGRFARDYRQLFGELPRSTLTRTRRDACIDSRGQVTGDSHPNTGGAR